MSLNKLDNRLSVNYISNEIQKIWVYELNQVPVDDKVVEMSKTLTLKQKKTNHESGKPLSDVTRLYEPK